MTSVIWLDVSERFVLGNMEITPENSGGISDVWLRSGTKENHRHLIAKGNVLEGRTGL